jgi:hypothetical protein
MPTYYAQVSYLGDGSTTQYSITFPFIDKTHIKAYINGTETTAFTISSSTLTFNTAPSNQAPIRIERDTPVDARIVDFTDGSVLTESDLDKSADQNFYIAQEIRDDNTSALRIDADDKFDAQNKVIKNLANPVNNNDAVNKTYLENTWLSPANKTALTTVNANIANINAVNSNETNINAVQANETNINTVSSNIASVNTVATNINDVIAVANDLAEAVSEVETVANDLNEATSEIDTVANSITNVDAVGTNIANVNSVAGNATNINAVNANSSNINTVAGQNTNITTLAGISSDITTVAGISSDVTNLSGISGNITFVAGMQSNINTVASNSSNINTVANNITNVNSVAGISSDVTTVAGISSDVTAVANDSTDIGTVATNINNINTVAGANSNITTVANDISNVNTVAGSITQTNAVAGSISNVNTVASNIGTINEFNARYRVDTSDPTTNNDEGDLLYNTTQDKLKYYNGSTSSWEIISSVSASSIGDLSDVDTTGVTTGQVLKYDGTNFTASDDEGSAFLKEQDKTISSDTTLTTDNTKYQFIYAPLTVANGTTLTVTGNGSIDFVNYNNFVNFNDFVNV